MSGTQKGTRIRSRIVIAGWPLFHVATGPDLSSGEIRGHARGIFAVGTSRRELSRSAELLGESSQSGELPWACSAWVVARSVSPWPLVAWPAG